MMEKLSAPRIRYLTTRMMKTTHDMQDMQDSGCQDVLKARGYDGMLQWNSRFPHLTTPPPLCNTYYYPPPPL